MTTGTRQRAARIGGADHCRDYVLQQRAVEHTHRGVPAHSTHLRGTGTYGPATGEERLATGIPESVCHAVNLGYRDPATIDVADFPADPGALVVPRAGDVLFRLR